MSEIPSTPHTTRLAGHVADAFKKGGALARSLNIFEQRHSQTEMSTAVADILDDGGILVVEAGTGIGKTLAYLVPIILSRKRVLISTGTKNLQEQIYFKDLPALQEALGVTFTATYMKGRANYLCLHRFEAQYQNPTPRSATDDAYLTTIKQWLTVTETGDRAELENIPEDLPSWNEISATNENCIGRECTQYEECFVTRMRQRASESDLVIVNHHLLCADAAVRQSAYGEVIPTCDYAVIDEAHQLEEIATQYFGLSVSNYRFDELAGDTDRFLSGDQVISAEEKDELQKIVRRIRERTQDFFAAVLSRRNELLGTFANKAGERMRISTETFEPIAESGLALTGILGTLEATLTHLDSSVEEVEALARRAREIKDQLQFLLQADDSAYVFYLEMRGRGLFLRAAPIDVSSIVREFLWGRMNGIVLTSATLTVDNSFDYFCNRLGIDDAHELRFASEFDFTRQAIVYLPSQMPDPRAPDFPEAAGLEVIEILKRTKGRAFVLFTSYANLRLVHAVVKNSQLNFPIFVQGDAPKFSLLQDFRSTPNAVLFATSSFWQGVDVAGEALSCVIIDKLPFTSPRDPITAARIEMIADRGDNPFTTYQIPLAILALQQGLGRLIRNKRDRGVLVILDSRIHTKSYGKRFLASLPPAPLTSEMADLEQFFAIQS